MMTENDVLMASVTGNLIGLTNDEKYNEVHKETFLYSLYCYPRSMSKSSRQMDVYSRKTVNTGKRDFTLKEIADSKGRSFRRWVADDAAKIDDYLGNDYHFLFVDIDADSDIAQGYMRYDQLDQLLKKFHSRAFPEVYLRKSNSTDAFGKEVAKPWKFHIYVRTRDPFYFKETTGVGKYRVPRVGSAVKSVEEMTKWFLDTLRFSYRKEMAVHPLAPADPALYGIHQLLQSAPNMTLRRKIKRVLPDTIPMRIPTKASLNGGKRCFNVPPQYQDPIDYPCDASSRYKAWGINILPRSFDVHLPSGFQNQDRKVQDGKRRKFARALAEEIWTAVKFNEKHYADNAELYVPSEVVKKIMYEVCIGVEQAGCNLQYIESLVTSVVANLDVSVTDIDTFIANNERFNRPRTRLDGNGNVVVVDKDPYCIRKFNRTSKKHADARIKLWNSVGYIKNGRLTIEGDELKEKLLIDHLSLNTLLKKGVKLKRVAKVRADKGGNHRRSSLWDHMLAFASRGSDGAYIVPNGIADAAFRKYCSRNGIKYRTPETTCELLRINVLPCKQNDLLGRFGYIPEDVICDLDINSMWNIYEDLCDENYDCRE